MSFNDYFPFDHFSLYEVFKAYFDCRKNKRNTCEVKKFEENLERNLMNLYYDLNIGKYEISRSICFVVEDPKYREVWAGKFIDRIVHHIIYNRIFDRFSRSFIYDSYACLPNRGTLFGTNRIYSFMRKCSENFNKETKYLQADIKNFFVSINKEILNNIVLKKVHEPHLQNLITQVIFHDPTIKPHFNSQIETFKLVPYHKSLFNTDYNHGLPIGNLTSQFFANIYLNELDQFVKRKLKVKFYGRYIDDLVMISRDMRFLNRCFKEMKNFVHDKLGIEFHPNKTITNSIDKGINFCGQIIKPYRKYIRNRTVKNIEKVVNNKNEIDNEKLKCSVNSYLGMLKWCNSYNLRVKISNEIKYPFDENILKIRNFNYV